MQKVKLLSIFHLVVFPNLFYLKILIKESATPEQGMIEIAVNIKNQHITPAFET